MTRRSFLGPHHLLPWLTSWGLLLWPGAWASGQAPADGGLEAASLGVYEVIARDCASGNERRSSGALLDGVEGLVTTLHSVAGCARADIIQERARRQYRGLRLVAADLANDVAVLASEELLVDLRSGGLPVFRRGEVPGNDAEVLVWGYPSGVDLRRFVMQVEQASRTVGEMVPAGLVAALQHRGSPSVRAQGISLNGSLQPGLSGGPVLTSAGEMVGIAVGGVQEGGFGWAAPVSAMRPVPAGPDDRAITRLGDAPGGLVFAHERSALVELGYEGRLSLEGRVGGLSSTATAGVGMQAESGPGGLGPFRTALTYGLAVERSSRSASVPTLPGLPGTVVDERRDRLALSVGGKAYLRRLLRRQVDPYLDASAGLATNLSSGLGLQLHGGLGSDLWLTPRTGVFAEVRGALLQRTESDWVFDRFGDARVQDETAWRTDVLFVLGVSLRRTP